ncbi:hypothetical protein E4U19_005542 [Claviceps sp. Clav32 group G5]|nr:hypothetical protein E4U19_005542 [Claviceps sp. Clav32 group G5]
MCGDAEIVSLSRISISSQRDGLNYHWEMILTDLKTREPSVPQPGPGERRYRRYGVYCIASRDASDPAGRKIRRNLRLL